MNEPIQCKISTQEINNHIGRPMKEHDGQRVMAEIEEAVHDVNNCITNYAKG